MPNHKCAQKDCPNTYTDLIGVGWGKKSGADCLPCFHAGMMRSAGLTPEEAEKVPELLAQFISHLEATGWTFQDVKDSYGREATLR